MLDASRIPHTPCQTLWRILKTPQDKYTLYNRAKVYMNQRAKAEGSEQQDE
jgi:hypothetical protein